MKIDLSKKYQTRDGHPVEFLHRAPEGWPGHYPWRGFARNQAMTWTDEGKCFGESTERSGDLIEVREPLEIQIAIDREDKTFGVAITDKEWYDHYKPDRAPFRIATFREVMQ